MLSGVLSSPPTTWREGHRRAERRAVGREAADRLRVVLRERADGQRRALGELAEAAAQDGAALGQHAHRHADARRIVDALDDVVTIHAEAELEAQPIVDAPAILREQRELGAAHLRIDRRPAAVGRALGERAVEAHDVQLVAVVLAVEARSLQVEADLEDVLAGPPSFEIVSASTSCRLRTSRSWRLKNLPLCVCGA